MNRPGEIVRGFLLDPRSRANFDVFFGICLSTAIGFLRYCESRGYRLPLHRADRDAAFSDLAITLLGELFRSEAGQPFAPVFDYFERHDLKDYPTISEAELYRHFKTLICGFIKKQLFRLRKVENSQAEILKRRIKAILRPPAYIRMESGHNEPTRVLMAKWSGDLRDKANPVTTDRLRQIVERAYLDSPTRARWCESVFELLSSESDLQNFVYLNDLLTLMVSVNADALQELLPCPDQPVSAETERIQTQVNHLVDQTVVWAEQNVIADFIVRGRIAELEGLAYCRALENYLLDLCHCGDTDSIPQYFREVMPSDQHRNYLSRHKYTFETVITRSVEYFREKLRESTT